MADLASLVGDFQVSQKMFTISGGIAFPIASADPTRWSIIIGAGAPASQLEVTIPGASGLGNGMLVQANAAPWAMTFRDHGSLVNQPFFAINVNASDVISVIQVLYRPSTPTIGLDDLAKELASLRRQVTSIPDHYHQQLSELRQQLSSRPHIGARK